MIQKRGLVQKSEHNSFQLFHCLGDKHKAQFFVWLFGSDTLNLGADGVNQQICSLFFKQVQAENSLFKHLELSQKTQFFAWALTAEKINQQLINKKLGYLFFNQIQYKKHGSVAIVGNEPAVLEEKYYSPVRDAGAGFEPATSGL